MFSNYHEAVEWIHSLSPRGIKPGLKRVEWMLDRLGHPEKQLSIVHIGGTNGKGSTVAFLRHILNEAGYRVGTFTSPYIEKFNERIATDGTPIDDQTVMRLAALVKPLAQELATTNFGAPTEFEVLTVMAFSYFAENPHDIILLEVGLGGRLDSTNVVQPLVSVITNIGHDHMDILGPTLADIAFEKAGIIKFAVPLVTGVEQEEAWQVIAQKAQEKRAPVYRLGETFSADYVGGKPGEERIKYRSAFSEEKQFKIGLVGRHQAKNAALAVFVADWLRQNGGYSLDNRHIASGLAKTSWPGRLEILPKRPVVVLDGAHNEEGMAVLADAVRQHFSGRNVDVLFSCLKPKNAERLLLPLYPYIRSLTLTSFDFPRARTARSLFEEASFTQKNYFSSWKQALQNATSRLKENDVLLVTGSLYFVSEVRNFLKNMKNGV